MLPLTVCEGDVETPKAVCDDGDEEVWKVPKADFERVVQSVTEAEEQTAVADGGER